MWLAEALLRGYIRGDSLLPRSGLVAKMLVRVERVVRFGKEDRGWRADK